MKHLTSKWEEEADGALDAHAVCALDVFNYGLIDEVPDSLEIKNFLHIHLNNRIFKTSEIHYNRKSL